MDVLKQNYDLVATASSAGVLLTLDAPWPLWLAWAGILTYQLANRWQHRAQN